MASQSTGFSREKIQYIKTDFDIRDDSTRNPFPGIWWGHYKDELPIGRCDCIAELDYNTFKKRYEIRLIAVRPSANSVFTTHNSELILDWRNQEHSQLRTQHSALILEECPTSWDDLRTWWKRCLYNNQQLAIAWSKPNQQSPNQIWLTLIGIAKYLSRTHQPVTRVQLLEKLGISNQALLLGIRALKYLGFTVQRQDNYLQIIPEPKSISETQADAAASKFLAAVREEQFQREYFAEVPLSTIVAMVNTQ